MARRARRFVSLVLSSALVILSVGLDAQKAAAQTLSGRAAPVSPAPQIGFGVSVSPAPNLAAPALSLTAPALSAPALASPAPVPAALKPVTPSAAIAAKAAAAVPALAALAQPHASVSAASVAGRDLEAVLTGAAAIEAKNADLSVAGSASALAERASGLSAASAPEAPSNGTVPAAAPAPFKKVATASSYSLHRAALKAVAALTGAVFTLPQAGPALTAKIIASAADKSVVLSDFDDTLAGYNEVLSSEKVIAVAAIRRAGKHFAVISDRGDTKRGAQLTVFESLESIPATEREGMYVAANSGGKVYRYDHDGVPQKVHEAAGLTDAQNELIKEAAAATKARLSEAGAVAHTGDGKNPAESFNTYGYALMLKPGSSNEAVKGAAAILNEELAKRGFEVEVQARFAKSPENPPYATFSIITKADAAAYITKALKAEAKDVLVIGDAMFLPRDAKKPSALARLGERLSGRPQAKTGNETDKNMTKLLPGALALGVGAAMDPRVPNGWALDGHGPDVTQKVLEAVASKPRDFGPSNGSRAESYLQLGLLGLIVGAGALGFYFLATAVGDIVAIGERALREWSAGPFGRDAGFFLGATTLGMAGMMFRPNLLANPNDTYGAALKRAGEIAVERGFKAEDLRFVKATASMPVSDGAQWHYTFALTNAKGGTDLIDVDFSTFLGGAPDFKTRVYVNAPMDSGVGAFPMTAYLMKRGVTMTPDSALDALRRAEPSFGTNVGVSLSVLAEPGSNDQDAWYRFFDNKGNIGAVNGRTGEVRVEAVQKIPAKPAGMTTAVEPNELFALALAQITPKAPAGADVKLLSAVHETRYFNGAWVGDEWRFFFGWGGDKGGVEYMVPARRTMITETMMDAFEPQLKGTVSTARLAEGVSAGLFSRAVRVSPDAALKGVDGVTRVSLLPRVEPVSGDKDLWYSLQNADEEVASVNARTGEVRRAAGVPRAGALKSFLAWVIGAALVALVSGGFYYAMSHAPAAAPQGVPEGYQGPIPSIDDVFRGLGGVLGLGVLAGSLKGGTKKPKVSDDDIRAAAKSVAASKGGVWSQTEYNMGYSNTLESLKARGATKKQLELFKKLCDEAPVLGGRFNPWSGD